MISIIVPIYNVGRFLPQCIDSLIHQTYKEIKIILVDDGSRDSCPDICDHYARKDSRILVIHQENAGVSAARNAGLREAEGEFIGFVDPDDWVADVYYERMLEAINEEQADLAISGYAYCHEDGRLDGTRVYSRREKEVISQKELMRRCSDIPPTIRHVVWNKLFRRSLLTNTIFPESLRGSEDVRFLTEYLLRSQIGVFIHEPYYFNRVRMGSAAHGGLSIHSLADTYEAHRFMYSAIIRTYPDLKNYSQAFLLDAYMLKYNAARQKAREAENLSESDTADLKRMRMAIRKEGIRAAFNRDIYWKTRLSYVLL